MKAAKTVFLPLHAAQAAVTWPGATTPVAAVDHRYPPERLRWNRSRHRRSVQLRLASGKNSITSNPFVCPHVDRRQRRTTNGKNTPDQMLSFTGTKVTAVVLLIMMKLCRWGREEKKVWMLEEVKSRNALRSFSITQGPGTYFDNCFLLIVDFQNTLAPVARQSAVRTFVPPLHQLKLTREARPRTS